jgi:hypothetical protein
MPCLRSVSATLLTLAALAAGEPQVSSQPTVAIGLTNAGEPGQIASAKLFVTRDGGTTWALAQEVPVAVGATALPTFNWSAPADGTYGFKTAAVKRSGGSEADPGPGVQPDSVLIIDRAAPTLDLLTASLGQVADGKANLAVSWKIADPNLGPQPVSIEVSTDQGKSFAATQTGAADGTTALNVPVANDAREVQVRLIARDLAGNVLTSPAKAVALPEKPVDPEAALAAAVSRLPKPDELGTARATPMLTAGTSPLAETEPAAVAPVAPVASTAPTPQAPAATADPASPEVVSGRDVEAAYAAEAQRGTAQPPARGRQLAPTPTPDAPAPATDRGTSAPDSAPFLLGADAERTMAEAMKAEADGDVEGALAGYLRLHRSEVAKEAVAAELALLKRLGDHATAAGIVAALPPELRTDLAKLAGAKANLALGRPEAAAQLAARVRAKAPEAREALLVLGLAVKAQGRADEAKRIFQQLASGNDEVAARARAEK